MSHPESATPFHHRNFLLYFGGRLFSNFSRQIVAVAVGWQVYELTSSPFHLGMVGLVQFLPALLQTSSLSIRSSVDLLDGGCSILASRPAPASVASYQRLRATRARIACAGPRLH